MMGEKCETLDEMVADAVSEFVNMVVGNAKASLYTGDLHPIQLGLPSSIYSDSFYLNFSKNSFGLHYNHTTDLGPLTLILEFKFVNPDDVSLPRSV